MTLSRKVRAATHALAWYTGCAFLLVALVGCGTTKPWIKAADRQPYERQLVANVFYDDFSLDEIKIALNNASEDFYNRTNFHLVEFHYYPITWRSKDYDEMVKQATEQWETVGKPKCHWYILIYKRNLATKIVSLPFLLLTGFSPPNAVSTAGECGNTMITDTLSQKILVHEFYHLGWGWKEHCGKS